MEEAECVLGNLSFYQGNLISNGWQAKNKDINHSKDTKLKVVGMHCRCVFLLNLLFREMLFKYINKILYTCHYMILALTPDVEVYIS